MLATVRPRDITGKTRRWIAAEELAELIAVETKMKKANAELKAIVLARGSHLTDIHGIGPVDVARFADRNRFASWTGTAPLDASSGEQNRHRLSRAGNRRVNHMIHIAAISQLRTATDGQAHYRRKRAEGKKPLEALRCLKRRISDAIFRQLLTHRLAHHGEEDLQVEPRRQHRVRARAGRHELHVGIEQRITQRARPRSRHSLDRGDQTRQHTTHHGSSSNESTRPTMPRP